MIRVVASGYRDAITQARIKSPKTTQFYTRFVMFHPTMDHKRIYVFSSSG